jgi:hypothetical protein
MGIVIMLGISCHLHASPHTHITQAGDHQDHHGHAASPAFDDLACIVAVMPHIGNLLSLPFRSYHVSHRPAKRLAPSVEFDIPPRFFV